MLAFMPPSEPSLSQQYCYSPKMASSATMSLAILPSAPMPSSYDHNVANSYPLAPSPPKKPRLTLDTSYLSTSFGKKATSLRLETLSATSPTCRNTFSNGHGDISPSGRKTSSPTSTLSPKRISTRARAKPMLTPLRTIQFNQRRSPSPSTPERTASSDSVDSSVASSSPLSSGVESASSFSTVSSYFGEAPYKVAANVKSILSNGPIPRDTNTMPKSPNAKKVAFKTDLEEEITTSTYVVRHSDLSLESSPRLSAIAINPCPPKESSKRSLSLDLDMDIEDRRPKNYAEEDDSDRDHDICPVTPVAGRNKKDREWVWTLGALPGQSDSALPSDTESGSNVWNLARSQEHEQYTVS